MKVCIGMPIPQYLYPDFVENLLKIIAYTKNKYPNIELSCMMKKGVMTSSNRNSILFHALEDGMDAILWLDSDEIYPVDILDAFIKTDKEIIGTIYYKRYGDNAPCVYLRSKDPLHPYSLVNTKLIPKDTILEVDGLGFGGMFVKTSVYKAMGEDKWMRYGRNFGIPGDLMDQESHDLIFCQTAKKYGFKIYVHGGVRAGHIADKLVTEDDWTPTQALNPIKPKIVVLMPSIDLEKANKTMKQLQEKAEIDADFIIIEDKERTGFMKTINTAVHEIDADYYAYVAEDAYAGRGWLRRAYESLSRLKGGLFSFSDGKSFGTLASFGLVEKNWMKQNYGGDLFYSGYKSHYGDPELTVMAMSQQMLVHDPNALLIEVDYSKHGVFKEDKALYNRRKKLLFDQKYWTLFS